MHPKSQLLITVLFSCWIHTFGCPDNYVFCASQDSYCTTIGVVAYGAGVYWAYKYNSGSILCANSEFGDPNTGVSKQCCIPRRPIPDGPASLPYHQWIANRILCGDSINSYFGASADQPHYYKLITTSTADLFFDNCDSDFDTNLWIYDASGNSLMSSVYTTCDGDDCYEGSCANALREHFTMSSLPAGTYYIRVNDHGLNNIGNYALSISSADCPTLNPTTQPTAEPTLSPTPSPTAAPSSPPSIAPTTPPSKAPTYFNCEDQGDIKHLYWNNVMDHGGDNLPEIDYEITASSEDKTLSISVALEYLGYSYINNIYGFGTTYHLGFYSFDGSSIISNCDNRLTSSFTNKTWTEYWGYSETPFLNDSIGTEDFLAYPPPSQYWNIQMRNWCSKLQYSAVFSWEDLLQCQSDDNETMAVDVDIDDKFINMSGIFFVDVYSPMSMESNTGHYYKYELLSYPFTISIQKSVNILSAADLFPYTTSIIFVGKNNDENILKVILLTESALGTPLTSPSLLVAPNNNQNQFNFTDDGTDCLSFRSNICSQIWEIEAIIDCPFIFSGDYAFQFSVIANGSNSSDIISLSTPLVFEDSICNDSIWRITYDAQSVFYNDSTFLTSIANDNEFIIGQDRVYVEIVVDDIDNAEYSILDAKLLNVWLCSSTNNGELVLNQNNLTSSGCFSSAIDADGPYHIIVNYNESFTNGARHEDDAFNNIVRFSFIVPDTIASDALYVQVQLGLEFTGRSDGRRRLLSDDKAQANQMFHHFVGLHVLTPSESPNIIHTTASSNDGDNVTPEVSHVIIVKQEVNDNSWMSVVMILMGVIMLIFVLVGIGCFVRYKRKSEMNKGYVNGQITAAVRVDSNQTECVSMDGRAGNMHTNEENDLL